LMKSTPDGCRSVFVGNLAKEANELGERLCSTIGLCKLTDESQVSRMPSLSVGQSLAFASFVRKVRASSAGLLSWSSMQETMQRWQ
jgi:hypothetical protein